MIDPVIIKHFLIQSETFEMSLRLVLAIVLGMLIGAEREHKGKAAGLRTYTLVSLGAALFTVISIQAYSAYPSVNGVPGYDYHLIANIVVGIGFLGAGLIVFKENKVLGLTTAAGMWVTAAIGIAAGMGFNSVAIFSTVLVLLVFWALRRLEKQIPRAEK
ncbi:MgtC/SapB family protein [Candidatus Giovannonibacteria bacterium]|nr:MgtC/SapB family protein [Candidatus Giovannonibacteria bacterium]